MRIAKKPLLFAAIGIIAIIASIRAYTSLNNINTAQTLDKQFDKRTAFGSYIIDTDDTRLMHTIKLQESVFEGSFAAGGYFQENSTFNLILLNNFKQVEFSVDGSQKSKINKIEIEKNPSEEFKFYKHSIKIENLNKGINDLLLIFTQNYSKDELQYYLNKSGTHRSTYLTRFNILCGKENKTENKTAIHMDSKIKILKGNEYALQDIFMYDKPFDKFVEKECPYNTVNHIKITNSEISLPLSINTSSQVEGSAFYEEYLQDEKTNKNETIGIVSLLNGELEPVRYRGNTKETVYFCQKAFKDVIMLEPTVEITKQGLNTFTTIAVCHPMANSDQFTNTYNYTKWSSGIVSNEIFIEK